MPIPRVKTEATSVESPKSKCGDNWDKNIKVRNPYKGVDKFARSLLSLAEVDLVNARDGELPAQLDWERSRVKKLLGDHKSILNTEQRINIEKYLSRAQVYLADAEKIQKLWASGFATAGYGVVDAFAININASDIGGGFCVNKPPGYKAKSEYEFNCPTHEELQGHSKDAEKWGALVLAAMKNIRCAEEVIRKAEVLQLNRVEWEKTAPESQFDVVGSLKAPAVQAGVEPIPKEAGVSPKQEVVIGGLVGGEMPAGGISDFEEPEFVPGADLPTAEDLPVPGERMEDDEEVGEGVLEGEQERLPAPPAPKKKKKKGIVPLAVAAGVGALLLIK